jgi:hypothetical protein
VRIYALPDAKIFKPADWADWAIYWKHAQDQVARVRQEAAENRDIPPNALATLACDPVGRLRVRAATHSATPREALAKLAQDPEAGFARRSLITTPRRQRYLRRWHRITLLRCAALATLAGDPDVGVRWATIVNKAAPPEMLTRLAQNDQDSGVRAAARMEIERRGRQRN